MNHALTCPIAERLLHPYIDGALSNVERQAVENHVTQCSGCRRRFVALERTVLAVETLPRLAAPVGVLTATMAAVRSEHARQTQRDAWRPAASLVLALVVLAGLTTALLTGSEPLLTALDSALDDPALALEGMAMAALDADLPALMSVCLLLVAGAGVLAHLVRGEMTARPANFA
jgi:anti-sigma factor RsiW